MRKAAFIVFGLALAAAGLIPACNQTPTRPSFLQPPPPPPPPPPLDIGRLELVAPGTIAPGASVQLMAIGNLPDGTTMDLTTTAFFRSSNTRVLSFSGTGLATAHTTGETNVQVVHSGRSSSKEVIVLPDGTFRLVGLVGESDGPTTPVVGARVEAIGGTNPFTTTGSDGRYRLYGVVGAAQIRVTKDGYHPHLQTVMVTDHQGQNFVLTVAAPRANLAGTYTLTVTAAASCRAALPEAARTRTYTVVLSQQGPTLEATLSDAKFLVQFGRGDGFQGRVEPGQVTFALSVPSFYYVSYYYPEIVEEITPTLFLSLAGTVVAPLTPPRFSAALNGSFIAYPSNPHSFPRPIGMCRSSSHEFELSR